MDWKNWKFATFVGVIVASVVGFFAAGLYYYDDDRKPSAVEWARSYTVSEVVGIEVKNPRGEKFGTIEDYVFDPNGRISFSILSYGEKYVAIPYGVMRYDQEEDYLVLDLPREKLDAAPDFEKDSLADRNWVEQTYKYFGQAPYWTE